MYTFNPTKTTIINLPFSGVLVDGFNRSHRLSEHLTFGEVYDATKVLNKEKLFNTGVPFPRNGIALFELLRSYTKKPLYLGSAHRSYEWELFKKRSGTSEHLHTAIDFNGEGLNKLIKDALHEKNELYYELRSMGVNGFGEYSWGWHLDFRENKPNDEIYFWSDKKKNSLTVVFVLIALFLIKKIFKNARY
mgnify:CR=1 FL=1|tara:strand:- start:137 stop:709 length:573 start_codon:yes stop_codon:yes gene_type:complete